ncbi:hypothetical protein BGW38_001009, partial [Lunasporangiospora selenospora]
MGTIDPIPTYRYRVRVGDEEMVFNSVSGLDTINDTVENKDGEGAWFQMPGQRTEMSISLKKGIFRGQTGFYDWISSVSHGTVEKKDLLYPCYGNEWWPGYQSFPRLK